MNLPEALETPTINAVAETINDLYKAELIYSQTWEALAEVESATLRWVYWRNTQQLHSDLNYRTPQEAKDHHRATQPTTLIPSA